MLNWIDLIREVFHALAGLPKKENAKLENIHFICTSNKVSVLEFAVAPVQELKLLEDGIVAYDAAMQSDVLIVDVTVGLHVHEKRTKTETVQQRSAIMAARTKGQINELKKRFGVSDATNPILDLCVDANQTPFEALLLGLYKYLFRLKIKKLSTNEKEELRARISAFSFFGCDAHFSRDMTRYYKSFVGRDLLNLQFIYYHRVWMMVKKKCGLSYQRCLELHIVSHLTQRWLVRMSQIVAPVLLLFKLTFLT
eukprot:Em0284g2a